VVAEDVTDAEVVAAIESIRHLSAGSK
jgi:hypothetical protein